MGLDLKEGMIARNRDGFKVGVISVGIGTGTAMEIWAEES